MVTAYTPEQFTVDTTAMNSATDSFKTDRVAELRFICNLMRSSEFCDHTMTPTLPLSGIFTALLDTGVADVEPAKEITVEPTEMTYDVQLLESDVPNIILNDVSEKFGGGVSWVYLIWNEYLIHTGNDAVLTYSMQGNFLTYHSFAEWVKFVAPEVEEVESTEVVEPVIYGDEIALSALPWFVQYDIVNEFAATIDRAYIHKNEYVIITTEWDTLRYDDTTFYTIN